VKRANRKAAPAERPEPLDYDDIVRLADAIAFDLMDAPQSLAMLLLLFGEISTHPREQAESVANVALERLFAVTTHADRACSELIDAERAKLKGGKR
jgi:hypothetical protein